MSGRSLVFAVILLAAAVTVARALISGDDVGPLEYVAGAALVVGLGVLALRASRRAVQPPG
jgi:hypothetical protein